MYFHICIRAACASFFVFLISVVSGQSVHKFNGDNHHLCLANEREALLHFNQAIQVDHCGLLSSWERHTDCCQWHGVGCSNLTRHVIRLHLPGIDRFESCLEGKLSSSLIKLKHLKHLNLSYNNFLGQPIPNFIGSLTNLNHLSLAGAGFIGELPHNLANLSRLMSLDLSYYETFSAKSNLRWLSHLTLLKDIDLSYIDLTEATSLFHVLTNLPFLRHLQLDYCNLSPTHTISSSLSYLNSSSDLHHVSLKGNQLTTSIFQWLYNMTRMSTNFTYLDLSWNLILGPIPINFGNKMHSLRHLDLSSNQIQGPIPNNFGNLSSLAHLVLSYNQLQGPIPESISSLKCLTFIDLSSNNFDTLTYQSPNHLGNLCSLETLNLSNNNLKFDLSDIINTFFSGCVAKSLDALNLSENRVYGSIPNIIGTFSSLMWLDISDNELNGTISPNIGQLRMLEDLVLRNNSLADTITNLHLSNLSSLSRLDLSINPNLVLNITKNWVPPFQLGEINLSSCKLGPHFPKWLLTQTYLSILDASNAGILDNITSLWNSLPSMLFYLNMSGNQMYGELLPLSDVFKLPATIDLSFNLLEGAIPPFPSNISKLYLSNNKFSNSIPFLCPTTKKNLFICDLSNNLLQGTLPNCWNNLDNLATLRMENNQLFGSIPNTIGALKELEVLHLSNNSFSGELPMSLKNCTSLVVLDLSYNSLTGHIPPWIGNTFKSMALLNLRNNYLTGLLPLNLCQLEQLLILDLSNNHILGTIPRCIHKFTVMRNSPDMETYADNYGISQAVKKMWETQERIFPGFPGQIKLISISNNLLQGTIPMEIVSLRALIGLDLSGNNLTGNIPSKIGQLSSLELLDLSNNAFNGEIPTSLVSISYLGMLNLSNNNLSGKIPSGTQLQAFDPSAYNGNPNLYGPPLSECLGDTTKENNITSHTESNNDKIYWLGIYISVYWLGIYISVVLGFIVGFWGVFGTLVLKQSWRHTFFRTLNDIKDKLYVMFAVGINRVFRKT